MIGDLRSRDQYSKTVSRLRAISYSQISSPKAPPKGKIRAPPLSSFNHHHPPLLPPLPNHLVALGTSSSPYFLLRSLISFPSYNACDASIQALRPSHLTRAFARVRRVFPLTNLFLSLFYSHINNGQESCRFREASSQEYVLFSFITDEFVFF